MTQDFITVLSNEQLAKHAANVKFVVLPNLLKANAPTYPDSPKQTVIAICEDCRTEQPTENTSQFCKCGAMIYPF